MSSGSDSHPCGDVPAATAAIPAGDDERPASPPTEHGFFVASHDALFAAAALTRCDACGRELSELEADDGYDVPGSGVYVWSRGGEVEREAAPLCPACASAIGVAALARWEIEEEEG